MTRLLFIILFLLPATSFAADKKDPKAVEAPTEIAVQKCQQAVLYSWKRIAPKPEEPPAGKKPKGPPTPVPTPDPDLYSVIDLVASTITEIAPTADEAKALLATDLPAAQRQALALCQEEHQTPGVCSAKKLSSLGAQVDRLDFDAKRAIQLQIIQDCQLNAGICIGTKGSEPTCQEIKIPAPPPPPGETGKDSKKK